MRRRHWGVLLSFCLVVLVPLVLITAYLVVVAKDQYSSTAGFTVRQEEGGGATDLLGGIAQFAGGSVGSDSDILYEFIQSQELMQNVEARLGIREHYAQHWGEDPAFSIWPDASIEDMLWFWQRVVRVSYDQASGLIELQVLAFDPDMAQNVAREILVESQNMINALNDAARADAMSVANRDLESSLNRLKEAREALTRFRTRTQIVDPETDIQGRLGVMNNLQQQLAQALIDFDLLRETARGADPRLNQAQRKIDVIRERILAERESFASNDVGDGSLGGDYPNLIAEYERLTVDRDFAEATYRASLTAVELARAKVVRQSRYLAAYIRPTLAETSQFPRRTVIVLLGGMLLLLSWGIMMLVYYSIRDRR